MKRSHRLWLLIISPSASQIKKTHFSALDNEIRSRIVTRDLGIEDAMRERSLHSNLKKLKEIIYYEEDAQKHQFNSPNFASEWKGVIERLLELEDEDRTRIIIERNFPGLSRIYPEIITMMMSRALTYVS